MLWEVHMRMTDSDLWVHSDGLAQWQPSAKFRATLPSNLTVVHAQHSPQSHLD